MCTTRTRFEIEAVTTDVHEIIPHHHHDHSRAKWVALAFAIIALALATARLFVRNRDVDHSVSSSEVRSDPIVVRR